MNDPFLPLANRAPAGVFHFIKLVLLITLFSCRSGSQSVYSQETTRDTSITSSNSYSDLFFDSSRLQQFVQRASWHDSLKKAVINFYNGRNYQYAWFNNEGFTEQVSLFINTLDEYAGYSGDSSVYEPLIRDLSDSTTPDTNRFNFEMALTASFIRYARRAYQGNIPLHQDDLNWFIPRKRINTIALLDSFVNNNKTEKSREPVNRQYNLLKACLLRYLKMKEQGGFPVIPQPARSYRKGDSSDAVKALKKRLYSTEDYMLADTTSSFTADLEKAVKQFQRRHGLKEDGVAGGQTLKLLNEPVEKRIEQLLVNMERMRWIPAQPSGDFILVNIPQYRLIAYENGQPAFAMNIVVGTSQNKTVIFTGKIRYVVFSPYWNVPPGIMKNEVEPAIRRDPSYLDRHHMERYNGGVRQKPGPWNSLGKVKFLFPNSYNIYLHDTPSKSLFGETKRSFSHGCIRVSEPQRLAQWILRKDPDWTPEEIQKAMNATKEKYVNVKEQVPVFIGYFTAWVDENGLANFREDIYGHDKKMAAHLFTH